MSISKFKQQHDNKIKNTKIYFITHHSKVYMIFIAIAIPIP